MVDWTGGLDWWTDTKNHPLLTRPTLTCGVMWKSSDCRRPAKTRQWEGRLQSLDWTGGLDWWTDTKNHFYASNEIHMPIGMHDAPQTSFFLHRTDLH